MLMEIEPNASRDSIMDHMKFILMELGVVVTKEEYDPATGSAVYSFTHAQKLDDSENQINAD